MTALTEISPTPYTLPTHLRLSDGTTGEIVDLSRGDGWITVRWSSGALCDYYAPTLYHGMTYLYPTPEARFRADSACARD